MEFYQNKTTFHVPPSEIHFVNDFPNTFPPKKHTRYTPNKKINRSPFHKETHMDKYAGCLIFAMTTGLVSSADNRRDSEGIFSQTPSLVKFHSPYP